MTKVIPYNRILTYLRILFLSILVSIGWMTTSLDVSAIDVPTKPADGTYVVDQTNTLSDSRKLWLNELGRQVNDKTKAQIAILIVKSTEGVDPSDYSLQVLRTWGIGDAKTNSGMLLLVALNDKKVRIEVGYGLEGIINDAKAGEILDTYALPYFKENKYETGITKTYVALAQIIAKANNVELTNPQEQVQQTQQTSSTDDYSWWQELLFGAIIIGLLIIDNLYLGGTFTSFLIMLLFRGGGRGGGGNSGGSGRGGFGGGSGGGGGAGRGW